MPIRLVISILKEVQRANKVHHGILFALKNFPGSHFIVCIFGVLKGTQQYATSHYVTSDSVIEFTSLLRLSPLTLRIVSWVGP